MGRIRTRGGGQAWNRSCRGWCLHILSSVCLRYGIRGLTSEEDDGSGFGAPDLVHYRAGIKCVVRKGNRDALFLKTMECS